jgi:hypothetical protein
MNLLEVTVPGCHAHAAHARNKKKHENKRERNNPGHDDL